MLDIFKSTMLRKCIPLMIEMFNFFTSSSNFAAVSQSWRYSCNLVLAPFNAVLGFVVSAMLHFYETYISGKRRQ